MTARGIDIREADDRLIFRAFLLDTSDALVTSGDALLSLYEVQDDGSLKAFDWRDEVFTSGLLHQRQVKMTHQTVHSGGIDTGVWTHVLDLTIAEESSSSSSSTSTLSSSSSSTVSESSTLSSSSSKTMSSSSSSSSTIGTITGTYFVPGRIYIATINHASARPAWQAREFQYGGGQEDVSLYSVVNDASPAAGSFKGDINLSSSDDFYNNCTLVPLTGVLKGIPRRISDYTGSSRTFTFSGGAGTADAPFPTAPANGDAFEIIGLIGD